MKKALLALAIFVAAASPAFAQQEDVAAFFKGKTLRLMVGIGVGSGYDINARLLARHMAAHIPGNPTIIVQNQPGAGSLTMTNALYASGPFDGTVMGASFNGMPTTPLLQPGRRPLRSEQAQLAGQHQPRDAGHLCLAHRRRCRASTRSGPRS